jgi:hypothetical protein
MTRLYEDLDPVKLTPASERIWENPDPRVKWALDYFDSEGIESETLLSRFSLTAISGATNFGMVAVYNMIMKRPLKSNLLGYAFCGSLGLIFGEQVRKYGIKRKQEEVAIVKHYIMLHPEKFPEPEKMKFGDKRVFYPWSPLRR